MPEQKPKRPRSIRFDEDDLMKAKLLNIDISKMARDSLKRAIEISNELKGKKK